MKLIILFLFCGSMHAAAQLSAPAGPTVDEQQFLSALNKLAYSTKLHHWSFNEPLLVDSGFHFTGDSITVTLKHTHNNSFYRIRYTAPVHQLKAVVYDLYLILEFKGEVVSIYEQTSEAGHWTFVEYRDLLHIGIVNMEAREERKMREGIEKAWGRLSMQNGSNRTASAK